MRIYGPDLAYIQAVAFGSLARDAAPEILRRLKNASIEIRHIVDAGCGAGPLSAALLGAGFQVTGIDISAELIRMARAAVAGARFIEGSIYNLSLPPCEAIIAFGEPLSYHAEGEDADSRVEGFFRAASDALPSGGLLIFDVVGTGQPPLDGRFWASGEDWAVLVETNEHRGAKLLFREIETFRRAGELYRRGREVHRVRLFDAEDLVERLSACGFSTETSAAYGTMQLPVRRLAFFSRKA